MKILLILLVAFAATPAHAVFREGLFREASAKTLTGLGLLGEVTDYQIGDEWGKKPVTRDELGQKSPAFARAAAATARFGGGTAFYLGKINGHHMMATNHHVMPDGALCARRVAQFTMLERQFPCEKFYGDWTGVDLALFSISVGRADDEALLASIARNFDFRAHLQPGQPLLTIGYGVFGNPMREQMANEDSDCKVFSERDDFRFISDPDRINPADYQAWSFAIGCDVSHGDSGSAIVDRQTGSVVGLIWTTATNKPERIRSSRYLDGLLTKPNDDVWDWLSYAIPAPKIHEVLEEFLRNSSLADPDVDQTLHAVLGS